VIKAVRARNTGLQLRPLVTVLLAGGKEKMFWSF